MSLYLLSLAVSLAVVSGFLAEIPLKTVCLKSSAQLAAKLTKEGWFCPKTSVPMYSECVSYSVKFLPDQSNSCLDYEYIAEVNTEDLKVEAYTAYEGSLRLCIVDFPLPDDENITLNLQAKETKTFNIIYCACDLITPKYIDALPQVKNITATVSCNSVNITWTPDILEGYEINEYIVTIPTEHNIELKVTDPYVVFNLTTSDKLGVLRPNSLYNVTVELIYCGGTEIGNSSSTIISTNMSSFVSENLTYTVQNVSDSSAYLQFQTAVVQEEVCVSLYYVSVRLDCEGQTTINDTYKVYVTPDHTVLVNVTVPVDKTCIATLKWLIEDIVVLSHKVILNTYRLYLSNIVGPVFTNHSAEVKQECLISCCTADSAACSDNLPHSQNSFSITKFQPCDRNFYTKCYSFDYSPTNEPEPSSCSISTATMTTTVTIHSNSSSVIPGCKYYVIGLSAAALVLLFVIVIIFIIAVAILIFNRQRRSQSFNVSHQPQPPFDGPPPSLDAPSLIDTHDPSINNSDQNNPPPTPIHYEDGYEHDDPEQVQGADGTGSFGSRYSVHEMQSFVVVREFDKHMQQNEQRPSSPTAEPPKKKDKDNNEQLLTDKVSSDNVEFECVGKNRTSFYYPPTKPMKLDSGTTPTGLYPPSVTEESLKHPKTVDVTVQSNVSQRLPQDVPTDPESVPTAGSDQPLLYSMSH